MFVVICDIRERELIPLLKEKCDKDTSFVFETAQLPLGDIMISCDNHNIMLERKTKSDMISSVKDGRYKSQGARMAEALAAGDITDYGYIIESSSSPSYFANRISSKDEIIYRGCILSISLRDRRPIFYTDSVADTARWICDIAKRLHGGSSIRTSQSAVVVPAKYAKSAGMTPESCFKAQLCQIPKISSAKADAIMTKWTSMRDMCMFGDADALCKELQTLSGIGKKLAENVCEYIGAWKPCEYTTPSSPPSPPQDILDMEDFEKDNNS